ncbi:SLOG family protein [Mycobacteroides abscessus]|uniref:SLOG family protein n=1 Tax=Mycobacteroides abscessus TaxID=36809 RepID=UPI0009A89E6A|nr:SLOG family protein [Mycobacteroides abscessus]
MTRRVLVTGSRAWPSRKFVRSALNAQLAIAGKRGQGDLVVVQGECPSGADLFASQWADEAMTKCLPVMNEGVPADWYRDCDQHCTHAVRWKNGTRYCPVAGHLRNQEMVDRGADTCIAFPLKDSRGTWDCMKRAERAGISVTNFGYSGPLCSPPASYHVDPHTGPCALAR